MSLNSQDQASEGNDRTHHAEEEGLGFGDRAIGRARSPATRRRPELGGLEMALKIAPFLVLLRRRVLDGFIA